MEKLNKVIQSLSSLYSSLKGKGDQSFWDAFLKNISEISDIAKLEDWQSLDDTCHIAENLASKISSGDISDFPKANQHLESILKIFDDLYQDIKSNGNTTISIKGQLAKVKMFIGDFVNVSVESKETDSSKDSEFSVDVMHELTSRVDNMEHLVLSIKGSYIEPDTINGLFREFHTLKGEAGFLGFEALGKFCHRVETILIPLRDKKFFVTPDIIDILLFCVDKTKLLILNVKDNEESVNSDDIINEKLSLLEKFINDVKDKPEEDTKTLRETQNDSEGAEDDMSWPEQEEEKQESTSEFADVFPLDDDEDEDEDEAESSADSPISSTKKAGMEQQEEKDGSNLKEIEEAKDDIVDSGIKSQKADQPVFLNVETNKVDSLINITGELTILYQMLQQSPEIRQITNQKITNNVDMMGRFFKELQNIALSIRTVSIHPLFLKMARLARELGRKSKKNVKVTISGEATQVDKNLISLLAGPLAHIIRNCVDHGVEPLHERIEANKEEAGHIRLDARKKGNNTLIEISDDGRGISFDRLEQKAKESGTVAANAVLTDAEKYELLFTPGLSTATKVTRTSGRGVGMDVVRSEVQKAKGTLQVKSELGKGTTTSLLFPQTFAITEGLVVRVKKNFFVIPLDQVKEMAQFDPKKLETVNNQSKIILIRDQYLPVLDLDSFLGAQSNGSENSAEQIMVTVENEEKRCVLLVDEVIDSQEVVVKELTGSFSDLPYFSGTAILGDKGVGLILDVAKITEKNHSFRSEKSRAASDQANKDDRINVVEIGTNQVAMIDFFIDIPGERLHFAINAFKTREFIPMDTHKAIPIPHAPNGFEGVITLRGKTLSIFSLAKLLALDSGNAETKGKDNIAIVCEFAKKTVGFLVSGVTKVNYISWNEILPPPKTSGKISIKNIVGTILKKKTVDKTKSNKDAADITFVLDFEKILNDVIPLYDSMNEPLKLKKTRKAHNVVLLVEDSAIMRSKMKETLESGGITVVEAENGQEALDIVNKYLHESKEKQGSIFDYLDLVISDIEMPQLDGYTLTKTIKSHPELRVLPVLLHSSLSNETIIQRAKEVHADGFISKSDAKGLLKALEKHL